MEQNSEDWLKFRGNSIGASEIAIIMGESPYKKRALLLKEKAFPFPKDEEKNSKDDKAFIFSKGHSYEPKIRNFVEFDLDIDLSLTPTVLFQSPHYKTPIHASLDGITQVGPLVILEAKYVGVDKFAEYKILRQAPRHYYLQMQQQLLITNAEYCIFAFCREVKSATGIDLEYHHFKVFPDKATQEIILIEAKKFWDEVLELRAIGPVNKDYSEMDDLINQYEKITVGLGLLEASADGIKKKIFALAGSEKIERETYTVQTITKKGSAKKDYETYLVDLKIPAIPDKYISIGKGSVSQSITFKKENKDAK